MAHITLQGISLETVGSLPSVGSKAPAFSLTNTDLANVGLEAFKGRKILNIVPSLDTGVCAASARRFNLEATSLSNTTIINVSADLPFAAKRFCTAEGINKVVSLSSFRSPNFGKDYGVTILSGPLTGLLARSIVVLNTKNEVVYTELVPEIGHEPDYKNALEALKKAE